MRCTKITLGGNSMKGFRKVLGMLLAFAMVITTMYVPSAAVKAAAASSDGMKEVSILSGTPSSSSDSARGTGDSYDGYIQGVSALNADYVKVEYTVSDASVLSASSCILNFQPYTSLWGGWNSNFITIGNSSVKDGVYSAYISMAAIKASLSSDDVAGVNISYVENTSCTYTLTGLYACTKTSSSEEDKSNETSILSGSVSASDDSGRGTGTEYDGYIQSFFDVNTYDYLKITYTVSDTSAIDSWANLFMFLPYTSDWSGWEATCVSLDTSTEKNGEYTYYISMDKLRKDLKEGDLYGVNLTYVDNADVSVDLTGFYGGTGAIPGSSEEETTDSAELPKKDLTSTRSQEYVNAMGRGWNLGNSFESLDTNLDVEDRGECTWGNPVVTKDLIHAIKEKGFNSVRIPVTYYRRVSEVNGKYVIDTAWLSRVKEVVDWCLDEDLHVLINMHNESWLWLNSWDGNKSSKEYIEYQQLWEQIAEYFKDEPDELCFETINEPYFDNDTGSVTQQDKLDEINKCAYTAIRNAGGKNVTRMIVMPAYSTNDGKCEPLYKLINSLNDENIIATIHYYGAYCFGANLGSTGFDDPVNGGEDTARDCVKASFDTVYNELISKGIGVVVGEWGLLGNDSGVECNEIGEELKYDEYMGQVARSYGVCLMMWDNGSYIDRYDYTWKNQKIGDMLEASMTRRSSYVAGHDDLYFKEEAAEDVSIPLTLNGNTFKGIEGLTEGTDYTYDKDSATVTLSKTYINKCFNQMEADKYGVIADLVFTFSDGADWHEGLVKYGDVTYGEASGSTDSIQIPVSYKGTKLRRVAVYQASGNVGQNHTWCSYLQFGKDFIPDYENGTLKLASSILKDASVKDGKMEVIAEFWDGQKTAIWMNKEGSQITCSQENAVEISSNIAASDKICLYAGEKEIPAQYISMPEGASLYGTWITDDSICKMVGWPAEMVFDTKAHDDFTWGGIVIYYYDSTNHFNVQFGIKEAPVVSDITVDAGNSAKINIANLADDAQVSCKVADSSIGYVTNGTFYAEKAGTTTIEATVTQYGRTDTFKADITVNGKEAEPTVSAPVETVEPTVSAPVETVEPTVSTPVETTKPSESAAPSTNVKPVVKVTTNGTSSIQQSYTITNEGSEAIDLTKLKVRFYYTKDGNKEQNFWCDNAGLSLSQEPWYVNYTSYVNVTFHDGYLELSFTGDYQLTGGSLVIGGRFAQADWSSYSNFTAGDVAVVYDGQVIK